MDWTPYRILLALLMLITGSINTLSTTWADRTMAKGIDGELRKFDHPFLQAVGMFIGEFTCLIVFQILRLHRRRTGRPMELGNQSFSPFIFLPASLCDMCGTSVMYIGLNLTYASSFQMLRGSVMIFTALLSVLFLRRVIKRYMWLGMLVVVIGLVLVGIADMVMGAPGEGYSHKSILAGDLLIILAQIVVAIQMVYEEKFVTQHNVPALQAVGWEGLFGFVVLGLLLIPMYFLKPGHPISNDPQGRMENPIDAFHQMGDNYIIIIATLGNIISIAFFNFAGISVTKEMSATTRMVLDSCRTLIIWIVSLALRWQPFHWSEFLVQFLGFTLLLIGMCLYNDLIIMPYLREHCFRQASEEERTTFINDTNTEIQVPNEATPILHDASSTSYDSRKEVPT